MISPAEWLAMETGGSDFLYFSFGSELLSGISGFGA